MSIDLSTQMSSPIRMDSLLRDTSGALREIFGPNTHLELTLDELNDGIRSRASSHELADRTSPFFLVSIAGEPETVGLMCDGTMVTVTMGAQRTKLEYVLGAAVAIAISRLFGGLIEDPWTFFGPTWEVTSGELLERLRLRPEIRPGEPISDAAERLTFGTNDTGEPVIQ